MKKQINRYARGVFDYDLPCARTNEDAIFAVVDKNCEFRGVLRIFEETGRELKGLVYSSNDQVIIDNPAFIGSDVNISYYVKSDDALNGDIVEGVFNIVCNGGELEIPYSFRIEAGSHDTMTGKVRNLFQFANLAQTDIEEAVTLFESDDFADVFLEGDLTLRGIYNSISKGSDVRNNIEEFLIAVRKKAPVNISIPDSNRNYYDVEENFKDSLIIEKDTWGYTYVNVSCDAPFVRLERRSIDSDAFTGNRYEFSYVIDASKLHGGNNYGRITFETINKKIVFYINARKKGEHADDGSHVLKKRLIDLVTLYIRFRTRAIPVTEWIRESEIVIEAARAIDDSNPFYRLALAQIYITEKKDEEAKALIENVKDEISPDMENSELYCYFVYVNTLYNKDWSYSKRAASMIRDCYDKSGDWRALWTLMFIDEELESNPSLKLLRIKEQFNRGCTSPIMYLEACRTFNQNPALLRVLNSFEINVLLFGTKNRYLDEKLCNQACLLINSMRHGTADLIRLMLTIWENYGTTEILDTLCRILVRNQCIGKTFLPVYEAGIKAGLKITQLFEYYMMSREPGDMSMLPKMVLMYFGYNNNLDYVRKAYLYANITYNKTNNPQAYRSYYAQIEEFVREQIALGHINEDLCTLYKNLLTPDMVTESNAEAVAEILFTYRIECNSNIFRNLIIRHKETKTEKVYPIVRGQVYAPIYTDDPVIIFVTDSGNRYIGRAQCRMTRLLENDAVIRRCVELNPGLLSLGMYYCEKNIKYQKKTMESIENLKNMIKIIDLDPFFRKKLEAIVIEYYYDSYDNDSFDKFVNTLDMSALSDRELVKIIEIRIIQGEYDKAYAMLHKHSAMHVLPKRLMKLCSHMVVEQNEPSDELTRLCYFVFSKGHYDEMILQYLTDNYNGNSKSMMEVWKYALDFEVDTYDIEERIIAQMMFTHCMVDGVTDIFTHYYSKGPKDRIVEAYLAYHSYEYFVKEKEVSEEIFELIEVSLENEKELATVCSLALVKYYSTISELTEFRKELASYNLYALARKGLIFPFYAKLKDFIRLPYDIADRTMVEYRANPKNRVIIHYMFENKDHRKKYVAEDMKQVYEGIFVKQFVIFYGESIQYYITEERSDGELVTDSETLYNKNINKYHTEGRYESINDIIASNASHDNETFRKLVHSYAVNDYVTSKLFKPI